MRRPRKREELIADVVDAWNNLPPDFNKAELMITCPELYFAVAWLTAHETVRNERYKP